MKKTTARTKFNPTAFAICIFLYIMFFAVSVFWIVMIWQTPTNDADLLHTLPFKIFSTFVPSFIILLLIVGLLSSLIGQLRLKSQIHHENRAIKIENPYQYYKELPNNFGIGIASLLANSAIENEKDIVAAILDLSAQKYLHLSKHSDHYVIRLEPNPPKTPLENEAYLLELIKTNQLQNINYQKWYDLCVSDGIQLGLFRAPNLPSNKPSARPTFRKTRIVLIAGIILSVFGFLAIPFLPVPDLGYAIFGLGLVLTIVSGIILYISTIAAGVLRLSKQTAETSYKATLEKYLIKTPKGTEELQKLYAFRAFLAQFRTFVDKDPEAVILWDRYLSYAQVFGLANEIMRTGYTQLIDNAAFKIDNIDHISLTSITKLA